MKKIVQLWLLTCMFNAFAHDRNLVIIIDNLQQETVKKQEINMTHQCITALQQRAGLVLVSTSLWKNIVDRKKYFTKRLHDRSSLESNLFAMYQVTNEALRIARYSIASINQKLSQEWFVANYPRLAELEQVQFNQLRFDFLCYNFTFESAQWSVYNAHEGMLLFVPREFNYVLSSQYLVEEERDLCRHADKKSRPVESLEKLLVNQNDRWVIYLTGHGHPKSSQQGANIAGIKIEEFKKLLDFLHESMRLKLLVYSSCYGGGVHTIEPYANKRLHFPVIVTAATDAPIFGFGLFEGVKLPPYDTQFKLQAGDVAKPHGLLPYALQNYTAFFKRAWKGLFDLHLIQYISRFFACDMMLCHVQKIENFPLIRKAGGIIFTPIKNGTMSKLVQQVTADSSVVSSKPLFLYVKKIKKIKIDRALPILSMLPGMQSHEIGELSALQIPLSRIIANSFLSLEDMQGYKNFMIKKLSCCNDCIGDGSEQGSMAHFLRVLIIQQQHCMPKFFKGYADALIYCKLGLQHYLIVWNDQKITDTIRLDQEQIDAMFDIEQLVEQSVNFDWNATPEKLLTFDAYAENKLYQQQLIDECVKRKVCKK